MLDPAQQTLVEKLSQYPGSVLWLADENSHTLLPSLRSLPRSVTVLSNRFDIHLAAEALGLSSYFNDWNFNEIGQFDLVAFRICKEKAVNRHIIHSARLCLKDDGNFLVCGEKNDGIKSFAKELKNFFDTTQPLKKLGNVYLGVCEGVRKNTLEDVDDYHQLSQILTLGTQKVFSKPGIYGWNKIDQGSQLLIEQFHIQAQHWPENAFDSILDLGCGYGYLTLSCADLPFHRRLATDNNAAAISACRFNAETNALPMQVVAADCADKITGKFSRIICNPPFHRGFDVQGELTDKFLQSAKTHLQKNGEAYFVVNSFIGIEQKAQKHFSVVETLVNDKQFKVLRLT